MALAINTGHALYPNVVALICVENGALVDLKTARTFTPDSGTSFGSGTYGTHFHATSPGTTPNGVEFSPGISIDGTTKGISVFFALNSLASNGLGSTASLLGANPPVEYWPNISINSSGKLKIGKGYIATYGPEGTTVFSGAPACTLTVTRNVGDQLDLGDSNLYVNGALEVSGGEAGVWGTPASDLVERLNSSPGYTGANVDFVYVVFFDKELTAGEIATLHASLTGDNSFALVTGAGPVNNPPVFSGPNIGACAGTVGLPISYSVASKFTDVDALTFAPVGTWPPGVTVSSAGLVSGAPTTAGTYAGLSVVATDTAAQSISSDTFTYTISATNAAPTFTGPNIGNLTGTVGTALTSNTVSDSFSDADALTFSAVGTWPAGVTVSSAGAISGTPTTAGTYATLKVRATDTAAQTVDSDTFTFTIAASSGVATFTTPEALENNAGSKWLAQAVSWTWTPLGRVGSMVGKTPIDGTGTTHATTGLLTVTGLPAGVGQLDVAVLGASSDLDAVYRCYGTAA